MSTELPEGLYRIEELHLASPIADVWGMEGWRHVPGWRLDAVDLGIKAGRPFGSLFFQRIDDGFRARIGVRWNHVSEQLHCFVTDTTTPQADRQALELDARSRVATLMSIYTAIGASAASSPVAASGAHAAAHLLPELPPGTG